MTPVVKWTSSSPSLGFPIEVDLVAKRIRVTNLEHTAVCTNPFLLYLSHEMMSREQDDHTQEH